MATLRAAFAPGGSAIAMWPPPVSPRVMRPRPPTTAMHLGAGYVWSLGEQTTLDVFGKYFLSHQGGDSVTLAAGDRITFDDVISKPGSGWSTGEL